MFYSPILRGKQFELIALRDIAQIITNSKKIFHIIEPVKANFPSLNKAIESLINNNIKVGVVLNPTVGDLTADSINDLKSKLDTKFFDSENFTPFVYIKKKTQKEFWDMISSFPKIGIIVHALSDLHNDSFLQLLESGKIKTALFLDENRKLRKSLQDKGVKVALIKDKFTPRKRNADYIDNDDELFTEEHIYASSDGYDGFSDYTLMQSEFTEGGWLPYAIAIHLSYVNSENQVFVKHLVSDSNDDTSNVQGKFGEALKKAIDFYNGKYPKTHAFELLVEYNNSGEYPGLGILKKISTMHHLELMNFIPWENEDL